MQISRRRSFLERARALRHSFTAGMGAEPCGPAGSIDMTPWRRSSAAR